MSASNNARPVGSEAEDSVSELASVDAETEAPETVPEPATPEAAAATAAPEAAAEAPDTGATEDHEVKLALDLEELEAKAQKADEYLELAQRTKADFENYRRRSARDAAVAEQRGLAKLAKELLPAVDNLERALQAAESDGDSSLLSGIKLVQADVVAALARVGIEPFSPEGETFDPQHHEAMAQQPVEGADPGTVVEVYQRGYRLGDHVLRPARVVVAA